jgi:hypothetical protein
MEKRGALIEQGNGAYEYMSDTALEKFVNLEVVK